MGYVVVGTEIVIAILFVAFMLVLSDKLEVSLTKLEVFCGNRFFGCVSELYILGSKRSVQAWLDRFPRPGTMEKLVDVFDGHSRVKNDLVYRLRCS